MSWGTTAIEIAEKAFLKYDNVVDALKYIQERVEQCPYVMLTALAHNAVEEALPKAPDVYSRAHERFMKEGMLHHETFDDMVKRFVFWLICIRAVDHYYGHMKGEGTE